MKWFTTLAAVLAVAFLATSVTMAHDEKEHEKDKPHAAARGVLVRASDTQIVVKNKKDVETTIKVDASTTVKIDGKEAKLTDLKAGMWITVPALENGVAKQVIAKSDHGKDEHHKDKDKKS